ncbi:universal stress protein [Pseudothauera rhizosphaerae]|uniref:Nucleotide-binding universal stress protein, UspA family n=1 Tax=Pseudothauera rhizosphaerae TaxID=2565932 RepID=A0A4S4ALF9_9RHOO|nr:universal stress protein [Pseudothauera rhizosphaerae]THF60366.1 hypothetical protein E6O51_14280 [Pseudothauera rhizosphaerae]
MYKNILIPVDESSLSMLVIERGVELARVFGARVTFLYLQADAQNIVDGDAGLLHAMSPLLFARKYLWADGYVEAKALAWARMSGVEAGFVGALNKGRVHEEIVEAARRCAADLIVIGSHGRRSVLQKILDSVTVKVLLHSPVPVFVAETGVMPEPMKSRVIARLRDEHADWMALADQLVAALDAERVDSDWIEDALACLARFSAEVHQPKETRLLAALRGSNGEQCEGLEEIAAEHEEEAGLFADLSHAWNARASGGMGLVRDAAEKWRALVRRHVKAENGALLLQAERALSDAAWQKVGYEVFGDDRQAASIAHQDEFRQLFARFKGH